VFVPIKYIYPSRTVRNHKLNLAIIYVWAILGAISLALYPNVPLAVLYVSLALAGYYVLDSLVVTLRRPSEQ
jgi:phosphatidylcholine synthase